MSTCWPRSPPQPIRLHTERLAQRQLARHWEIGFADDCRPQQRRVNEQPAAVIRPREKGVETSLRHFDQAREFQSHMIFAAFDAQIKISRHTAIQNHHGIAVR